MIAVIELGGNQFIVKEGDIIDVKKLALEVNDKSSTEALLISDEDGKETKVGTPIVAGSKVAFTVLEQYKGEKIRVFKMKSKKRYSKNVGFRPHLTKIEITKVA
ncbi:MAG: 50S ribosomal protein L21 [Candidatus Gracilibacteria bacterium]|nr:50S ribosomal protein L21 [Candidatus Gracilibacteria bacterium]MDQ7022930.1 50S ribosomal protein L21 [Candidatus Gracilibacteria bacterium]